MTRAADDDYPGLAKRIAYLIDPEGIVKRAYEVTDVQGFAGQVVADLQEARRAG